MTSPTSTPTIRELCEAWEAAVITPSGDLAVTAESQQYRLHNSVAFHELSFVELCEAAVGLTKVLMPRKRMTSIIDLDHVLFWSWCAEVLLSDDGPLGDKAGTDIAELSAITFRTALAGTHAPDVDDAAQQRRREVWRSQDLSSQQLLTNSHQVLAYLAFPFLEAVSRRACSAYVDLKGTVLQPFPFGQGTRLYEVTKRCSNVSHLLRLLVTSVASPALQADLDELLQHIHSRRPLEKDGYAVLFDWRNSSLHGEVSLTTIGSTVLSVATRIALELVGADYASHQAEALKRAQWEVSCAETSGKWEPPFWSYYPPFHVPSTSR